MDTAFGDFYDAIVLEHSYQVACAEYEHDPRRARRLGPCPTRAEWARWWWWARQPEWFVELHEDAHLKCERLIVPF